MIILLTWEILFIPRITVRPTTAPKIDQPTSTPYQLTPSPTPRSAGIVPKTDQWIQYMSKCSGLQEVTIFYPQSWKVGSYGEMSISSGFSSKQRELDLDECMVQFGYPFAPGGKTDSYVSGQYAEIWIGASKHPEVTNLDDLMQRFNTDPYPYASDAIYKQTFDGTTYVRQIVDNANLWYTFKNGRKYIISFRDWNSVFPDKFDALTGGYGYTVAEEFLNKLRFK